MEPDRQTKAFLKQWLIKWILLLMQMLNSLISENHAFLQIRLRRCDDMNIHSDRILSSQPYEFLRFPCLSYRKEQENIAQLSQP